MEDNLSVSDIYSLKILLNEPLYLIKEEFSSVELENKPIELNERKDQQIKTIFQYKGQNLKKTVFIVFINESEIPGIDKVLYSKTLSALKLNDDDVALSVAKTSMAKEFNTMAAEFPNQRIICFADTEVYKDELLMVKSELNTKFLLCPSLSELQLNQELKIKWWNGLKTFISE